ncbi:hypothetical protein LB507_004348 [Fusarium sp. FIESC RH6]|nr:hypothetical protein LB507_004348 [Fusarium sp. FIESC RH6]
MRVNLGRPRCVMGFEFAFHIMGIRAIKVIAEDGTRWGPLGDPKRAPWKLLESDDGISTLHACFDATKLQILERPTVVKRDDQDWRLDYLWTPKIPPEPVELWNHNDLVEDGLFQEDDGVPIQVCTWGLEGDNRRWDQGGSGITADFDDGENITGLEVQISQGLIVGPKVKTDRRKMRPTHRGGPLDRDPDIPWLSVKPEPGNRFVGIWTTGHGFADALFNNIGLITVEE